MAKICKIDPSAAAVAARMDTAEFRGAMIELRAKLDTMADILGICRRNLAHYRKGNRPVPPHVAMAVRHLLSLPRIAPDPVTRTGRRVAAQLTNDNAN